MLAAVLVVGNPQSLAAQSVDDQIQRLQRELSDLQRQVYGGEAPATGTGAGVSPTQAARIELRLNQFEAELRSLTGQVEEMRFQTDSVTERLDRLVADVDLRLQQLEGGAAPTGGGAGALSGQLPGQAPAAAGTGQGFAPSDSLAAAPAQSLPSGTASSPTPGTLGTVAETDLQNFRRQQQNVPAAAAPAPQGAPAASAPAQAAALPGSTPREQYDYAFGLLRQANYDGAEQALSTFLAQHPQDPLAGNAKYWLGETYYVRGNYQQAAVTFAEGFEAYPNNPKAPDNLLKLGMSLASLGSKDDACGTFEVLQQRYADASATIIQRARQEAQRIGC
ncbi:tol-pal system protein YbgF [Pelagibius sp.]|uniref:tol-pal system protein YbgF n=1 Tax=Pelagibius sp. TaxID=1931238 RepID=UPI002622A0E1|nr:tol-pal system protein YbgF [Pelagibius sp.]